MVVIELTCAEIATAVGGVVDGDPATRVTGVSTDSRTTSAGDLFVALRGEHGDGHDHAGAAVAAGAMAVMVEHPGAVAVEQIIVGDTWQALAQLAAAVRDRVDPTVVAITGSVGKTTTKDLTAAAVRTARRTVAAPGSFNNELGVPLTLLACEADTEVVVTEVGARGVGDVARLASVLSPHIGVVTSVAEVHLELFGTIEAVSRAKGELVEALPASGTAILNGDDQRVDAMAGRTGAHVLRFGSSPRHDVVAGPVTLDGLARPSFDVSTPWGAVEVRLPVAGGHQVGNALAALAVAGVLEVDLGRAAAALADAVVSRWRAAVEDLDGVILLDDAYNANPTSMRAALATLEQLAVVGRRIAVLGVMAEIGPSHQAEHLALGRSAAGVVDLLVVVGPDASGIVDGAIAAGMDPQAVTPVPDADAAAAVLADGMLASGDAVLVKASRVAGLERVGSALREAVSDRAPT